MNGVSETPRASEVLRNGRNANQWQDPGRAAYDFRSDVVTSPTTNMLEAIINTTLYDDVYDEDPTTHELQSFIAQLTGHEAGLLVMSGTMGNQVALRVHLNRPPHSVICDSRSHIYKYEAGGAASLSNAMLIAVNPNNDRYLTLEDVKSHIVLSDDQHACPTRVISLENTLDGQIMPLSEVERISSFARENNIIMHLDGARIWEAVAAGAGSLFEFATLFDSVSLCFSKGLGAPIGSMLVGTTRFISSARHIRKMIGGGTRQAGVISAAARVAVEENFGKPNSLDSKLAVSHRVAKRIAQRWESNGGSLLKPTETNMVWLDLEKCGCSKEDFIALGNHHGLLFRGGRLVVHYQICDDAVTRLEQLMFAILKPEAPGPVADKL